MGRKTLDLLPGLRWEGKLHVLSREPCGGYLVDFDAVDLRNHGLERHIMDRAILTPKQLKDWTGWASGEGE